MSFVSIEFGYLFSAVFILLWAIPNSTIRKMIILSASCIFYAYWDWRFLGLLASVTVVDFYISKQLALSQSDKMRKLLLSLSIIFNLGILGVFKYFNFFIDNLNFLLLPLNMQLGNLKIILPIGISFFTFETLSYVIDVYRKTTQPANSLLDYAVFISFFPRLVAGPIMRASQFLPQLERGVVINVHNLIAGAQLFAQGLIKKVIIADRLSVGVDIIFSNPNMFSSGSVWLGVAAYSIQILCDFSGYTDMAIGISKMIGIELQQNFNLPYTSQSITEFWTRWHISLSTWFRDYLFLPLAYAISNRLNKQRYFYLKTDFVIYFLAGIITFIITGLWHGAAWHFMIWGGLHGLYLVIERFYFQGKVPVSDRGTFTAWARSIATFVVVSITWVFFRSPSFNGALVVFLKLFFISHGGIQWLYTPALVFVPLIVLGGLIMARNKYTIPVLTLDKPYAIPLLLAEFFWIYLFFPANVNPFIYFQF